MEEVESLLHSSLFLLSCEDERALSFFLPFFPVCVHTQVTLSLSFTHTHAGTGAAATAAAGELSSARSPLSLLFSPFPCHPRLPSSSSSAAGSGRRSCTAPHLKGTPKEEERSGQVEAPFLPSSFLSPDHSIPLPPLLAGEAGWLEYTGWRRRKIQLVLKERRGGEKSNRQRRIESVDIGSSSALLFVSLFSCLT